MQFFVKFHDNCLFGKSLNTTFVALIPKKACAIELFACWQSRFGRHRNGDIWMVVPHCLMWCIWKERNSRCFEDNERSMPDLKLLVFRTLLEWFSVWRNHHFSSFLDFLDLCNLCN